MSEHREHDARGTLVVQNVVASTGIDQELALESVAMDMPESDYDPENFPGVIYRTTKPRTTILLFRSGKLVLTGASSVEAVEDALSTVFAKFRNLASKSRTIQKSRSRISWQVRISVDG